MATSVDRYAPVFMPGDNPFPCPPTEKPGRPQSTGSQRVEHNQSAPACIDARLFLLLPVAALPQCELSVKVAQLLGLWGPWWCQECRDTDGLHCRSYGPIRVFFQDSCSWQSEGLSEFSVTLTTEQEHLLLILVNDETHFFCIVTKNCRLLIYCFKLANTIIMLFITSVSLLLLLFYSVDSNLGLLPYI